MFKKCVKKRAPPFNLHRAPPLSYGHHCVCAQFDDIKNEYESLKKKNQEQSVEPKTLKVNSAKVKRNDFSTAHRLPHKRHSKIGDPPGIIARFISRNVQNEIYSKRAVVKSIDEKDFPVQNMKRKKDLLTKI